VHLSRNQLQKSIGALGSRFVSIQRMQEPELRPILARLLQAGIRRRISP
jgi:hypothetical protein